MHLGILPLVGVSHDGSDLRGASEEDLNILLTLYFPASRHWWWKWVNTPRLGSGGLCQGSLPGSRVAIQGQSRAVGQVASGASSG